MSHNTNNNLGFYRAISDCRYCYIILSDNTVLEPHPTFGYIVYSRVSLGVGRGVLV